MHRLNFESLSDVADVAGALGCQKNLIEFVIEYPSNFYEQLLIPRKRRKEPRVVYEVNQSLKGLHKNILFAITAEAEFPEYVQGFVSKRSIVTNASMHLSKHYVLCLDIRNFFESISITRIVNVFLGLGCNDVAANIFAKICTFNDCLVQGANTSPILANLVCTEMDKELATIARENGCSYSRYADDITFSGDRTPKKKVISQCLKKYGFSLNTDKWNLQRRGETQYVTGLTVFDDVKPRLPKAMKRKLRQTLYYASNHGLNNHFQKTGITDVDLMIASIYKIDGLIAFMYSVEPNRAYEFDEIWQSIRISEDIPQSRYPSKIIERMNAITPSSPLFRNN
jgi:RNA-directed DNA polymerase